MGLRTYYRSRGFVNYSFKLVKYPKFKSSIVNNPNKVNCADKYGRWQVNTRQL